jgi:alpha-1,3-rhamnosyl/mannosyltransferase
MVIPVKIIIDARTATPHFPGIGRYVSNLIEALNSFHGQISIHVIKSQPHVTSYVSQPYPSTVTNASVFSLSQQWVVPKLIDRVSGSLYHSTYYLMPYMVKIPVVFTCYDLIPVVYPKYFKPLQRLIYKIAHLAASKVSSHIIAISESTKSDLMKYFSIEEQKISVIPLAADTRFSRQTEKSIDIIRSAYSLPVRYCLYVGTNKPHKNLLGLVKAWRFLHEKKVLDGYSLVIAGHWDTRYPEAKEFVSKYNLTKAVKFMGDVEDEHLPAIYSGAALFIHPSLYEGFGLPIIEAMACGTAVACSNISSLPEVAGNAATYFNPTDPMDIAVKLGDIFADRSKLDSLRDKSIHQAARFSWHQTALQTMEVYQKACIPFL